MKCEAKRRTVNKFSVVGKHEPEIVSWSESMGQGNKAQHNSMLYPSDHQPLDLGPRGEEGQAVQSQGLREVSILSPDPLVRTFLQGILKFQGFQSKEISGFQDVFWDEEPCAGQAVFIEDSSFIGRQPGLMRPRLEKLVQRGVYFLILAEQHGDIDFSEFFNNGAYQILWKPLDYRKIGQAMAHVLSR